MIKEEIIKQIKDRIKNIPINDLTIQLSTALCIDKHKYDLIINQFIDSEDSCFNFPILHFKYHFLDNALNDFNTLKINFPEIKVKNSEGLK